MSQAPRPGRPGRPKSPEKAADIRQAAGDLFLAHGMKGTSMDAVAHAAGVSKQTVYSHYGSKEDLFAAVIRGKVSDYGLTAEDLSKDEDLKTALERIGLSFVELLLDEQVAAMFRVVIGESVTHPEVARLFHEAGPERTLRALAARLGDYADSGLLVMTSPREAAVAFLNLLRGEFHMQRLMNLCPDLPAAERRRHVRRTVSQFLRLYAAEWPDPSANRN